MCQGEHNIEWAEYGIVEGRRRRGIRKWEEHLNTRMRDDRIPKTLRGYKPKGCRSPESLVGETIRRRNLKNNLSFQKITDSKMYHGTPIVPYNI